MLPIGKAKVYGKLSVQRTRNDTIRIIICDTSLFRNDDGKGAIMLNQCGDRFLIQADNAKGELLSRNAFGGKGLVGFAFEVESGGGLS